MKWKVCLNGDDFDLNELSKHLKSPGLSIDKEEDGFFLKSTALEPLDSDKMVYEKAKELLQSVFGVAKSVIAANRPIEIAHLTRTNENGSTNRISFSFFEEKMNIRDSFEWEVAAANGTVTRGSSSSPMAEWIQLALTDENVAKAMKLMAEDGESWDSLYKLFELVRANLKEIYAKRIYEKGWATKEEISDFTQTANSYAAIGLEARHSVDKNDPPEVPMSHADAKGLVQKIVQAWISDKLREHGNSRRTK